MADKRKLDLEETAQVTGGKIFQDQVRWRCDGCLQYFYGNEEDGIDYMGKQYCATCYKKVRLIHEDSPIVDKLKL